MGSNILERHQEKDHTSANWNLKSLWSLCSSEIFTVLRLGLGDSLSSEKPVTYSSSLLGS